MEGEQPYRPTQQEYIDFLQAVQGTGENAGAELAQSAGLIPYKEAENAAIGYVANCVFDGNALLQQAPSAPLKWAENYLATKYGTEIMDALYKNIAAELTRLPSGAPDAVREQIVSEQIDPLIDHLFTGLGGDAKHTDMEGRQTENTFGYVYTNDLIPLARNYVNHTDRLFENLKHVKPVEGYEDFGVHGDPENSVVTYQTNNGVNTQYSGREFAGVIKSDPSYHGENVRLLSCGAGSESSGFAQELANALKRYVMAPTETLWVGENGQIFISNYREL